MVTNEVLRKSTAAPARALTLLGRAYLALVVGTLTGLTAVSVLAPSTAAWAAPQQAWVHQGIVTVFGVVLLLRLRRAAGGSVPALRATGIISGVLVVVNVVEARIPGLFPGWMQALMLVTAVVLVGIIVTVIRARVGR
jgi:hypothetical protein